MSVCLCVCVCVCVCVSVWGGCVCVRVCGFVVRVRTRACVYTYIGFDNFFDSCDLPTFRLLTRNSHACREVSAFVNTVQYDTIQCPISPNLHVILSVHRKGRGMSFQHDCLWFSLSQMYFWPRLPGVQKMLHDEFLRERVRGAERYIRISEAPTDIHPLRAEISCVYFISTFSSQWRQIQPQALH